MLRKHQARAGRITNQGQIFQPSDARHKVRVGDFVLANDKVAAYIEVMSAGTNLAAEHEVAVAEVRPGALRFDVSCNLVVREDEVANAPPCDARSLGWKIWPWFVIRPARAWLACAAPSGSA